MSAPRISRIESIRVENFRALRQVRLEKVTPLTVLLGPNGSGKSTLFDVFSFLSECFQEGLRPAWDNWNRAAELRTRGQSGPVVLEIRYRETPTATPITYHLAIDEDASGPVVVREFLQWTRGTGPGRPFKFLDYRMGRRKAALGKNPDKSSRRVSRALTSPDLIAVNALGQLAEHPRVATLRSFITDWHVSFLSVDQTRGQPQAGPQKRLSRNGDNLANVIQHLSERHPAELEAIFSILRRRVPRLERVLAEPMRDGRLLLQIKDAPFESPMMAKWASDGTLKMLAYLVLLHDPEPPRFIGIEEPENFLHPRLLPELAEEFRASTESSQLLVTTHSPFLLDGLKPDEVRVLYRDEAGHTRVVTASEIRGIPQLLEEGATLGYLWTEGHFGVGDPLVRGGAPIPGRRIGS